MKERILLLTHGGWGSALLHGVEMILGTVDFVDEIPLYAQDTRTEFEGKIEKYIKEYCQADKDAHLTIMTDMFGGTTTNTAAYAAHRCQNKINVITGLNAPLLLGACSQIVFDSGLDIPRLLDEAGCSIFDVMEKIRMKGVS